MLFCLIVNKADIKMKETILFKLSQFDCPSLEQILSHKNSEELIKFFDGILQLITEKLDIY